MKFYVKELHFQVVTGREVIIAVTSGKFHFGNLDKIIMANWMGNKKSESW
jgi:hypothetical protein